MWVEGRGGQSMTVTLPVLPSTRITWPVVIVLVPKAVPVTAGFAPYLAWVGSETDTGTQAAG